jgi:hypothetical protein
MIREAAAKCRSVNERMDTGPKRHAWYTSILLCFLRLPKTTAEAIIAARTEQLAKLISDSEHNHLNVRTVASTVD